ncbi:hypothetical protein EGT74_25560 [Chitinophaga lutea]|uniref:Uncharacterized protein n=1 Tax=Chitinophaga lutea TaxID=2488634 RepID=A0A3N4Q1T6_9BACT|nr:hypothetical protein EGT74_25560 [Chitinophaga lutea]
MNDVFAGGFQQKLTLIRNFLSDQQENAIIRLFVPAVSGVGHQATSVNMLYRLISLGFQQTVQVIYDDSDDNTGNKLKRLIPGFNPATNAPVVINNATLTFYTLEFFETNPNNFPELGFGFTGGYDNDSVNLADKVNVTFFLKLQPFEWSKQNAVQRKSSLRNTWPVLEQQQALGNITYRKRGYFLPAPQLTHQDLIDLNSTFPGKQQPYQDVLAVTTGHNANVNLLPVYGIGDNADFPGFVEADPSIRPESVLLNLICAVADRQQTSNVQRLRRSAIILVAATISPGPYQNLASFLSGNADNMAALNGYINGNQIPQRVSVLAYTAPTLQQAINALPNANNHILVINMGGLTIATFNYLYSCSTLPCVFEGKGTANLVMNLNMPYLNVIKSTTTYPTLPLHAQQSPMSVLATRRAKCMNTAAGLLNTALAGQAVVNSVTEVSQQIEDSYDNTTQMYQYFAGLSAFFHNEEEDKLILGLLFFLGYVNTQN